MQKRETLAQLIRRTVLEFEQRQAAQLQQESSLENDSTYSNLPAPNEPLAKDKSQPKRSNRKKKIA
jgi:hypothetical protein